jgi:hypothetical protein
VKKGYRFPVPSRDVTNQTPPGRELFKLFPTKESLVSDIQAWGGKNDNLFITLLWHSKLAESADYFKNF